ncbi:MAG: Na/Pi cotransporter family protein [Dehalococcoidales bacterium]|nr:Na/Pi cotransporter family protein [Dehalococcoidales bacterium]
MDIKDVISLLSGVALFLFGMKLMGDGLKKLAGNKLEILLYKLTNTTLKSVGLGAGVTAVIQSSSATSIMTVGFVNSGMMKVRQAIGIILGAILGTSVTGWIICLSGLQGGSGIVQLVSASTIAGFAAIIGIYFYMFTSRASTKQLGSIFLGFAVLMFGMSLMSGAVAPLKESQSFISILTAFSNPILGILVGILISSVLQSASAAVGLLQALTATDALNFSAALPLIIGIAIGAAVPVLLSTFGAGRDGKRTAYVYLIANVMGAVICGAIFYISDIFIDYAFADLTMTTVTVALLNTLYRLAVVIVLFPFVGFMEKFTDKIVPVDNYTRNLQAFPEVHLEERFIPYTSLALAQCREVTNNLANMSRTSANIAIDMLFAYDEKIFREVESLEARSDQYEDSIGTYLMKVTRKELNSIQNVESSKMLHTLPDFERISDHALTIAYVAKEIHDNNIKYAEETLAELKVLRYAIGEILDLTVDSFVQDSIDMASKVEPLRTVIEKLCNDLKANHIERLKSGVATIDQGFTFNDLLTSYERIAGHSSNIALAMLELETDAYEMHGHLKKLSEDRQRQFDNIVEQYFKKYSLE